MIITWLGIHGQPTAAWHHEVSVHDWWLKTIISGDHIKKAVVSVMMLVSWEIWKEQNMRVFRNTATPSTVVVVKIKEEAHLWALAGASHLSTLMSRE
jgi:hypothetical protein